MYDQTTLFVNIRIMLVQLEDNRRAVLFYFFFYFAFVFWRWVKYFRQGILKVIVNNNNDVERKNKDFKYEFLSQHGNNILSGMVAVLVEEFLSEIYSRYVVLVTFKMLFFIITIKRWVWMTLFFYS